MDKIKTSKTEINDANIPENKINGMSLSTPSLEKEDVAPLLILPTAKRTAKHKKAFEVFAELKAAINFSLSLKPEDAMTVATPELTPGNRLTKAPDKLPGRMLRKEGILMFTVCFGTLLLLKLTIKVGAAKSPVNKGIKIDDAILISAKL